MAKSKQTDVEPEEMNDTSRSALELIADDILEPKGFQPVVEGVYELEITKGVFQYTKLNNPAMVIWFSINTDDDPELNPGRIRIYYNLPYERAKPGAKQFFKDELARFRMAFGIEASELAERIHLGFQELNAEEDMETIEFDDYNGWTAEANLIITNDETYGDQNEISSWVA